MYHLCEIYGYNNIFTYVNIFNNIIINNIFTYHLCEINGYNNIFTYLPSRILVGCNDIIHLTIGDYLYNKACRPVLSVSQRNVLNVGEDRAVNQNRVTVISS